MKRTHFFSKLKTIKHLATPVALRDRLARPQHFFSSGQATNASRKTSWYPWIIGVGSVLAGMYFLPKNKLWEDNTETKAEKDPTALSFNDIEVLKANGRVVIAYGRNVYDVTDFVPDHPGGGGVLQKANGHDIREVWSDAALSFHKTRESVQELLPEYKIGRLQMSSELPLADPKAIIDRSIRLRESVYDVFNAFNAEPHELEFDSETGATEYFFIRDHSLEHQGFPSFSLVDVEGGVTVLDDKQLSLLGAEDKLVPIICAGAGRSKFTNSPEGTLWGRSSDAIGAMQVRQVAFAKVLEKYHPEVFGHKFLVKVVGGDDYYTVFHSDEIDLASIAISLVPEDEFSHRDPIPDEHGGPIRLIMKGCPGFRQIKWVKEISFLPLQSEKALRESLLKQLGDPLDSFSPIQRQILAVCKPMHSYLIRDDKGHIESFRLSFPVSSWTHTAEVEKGKIKASGVAFSGENAINKIVVSADDRPPVPANVLVPAKGDGRFVLWRAELPYGGEKQITARAVDDKGTEQLIEPVNNKRGLYRYAAVSPTSLCDVAANSSSP